jgi:hypothetical protein
LLRRDGFAEAGWGRHTRDIETARRASTWFGGIRDGHGVFNKFNHPLDDDGNTVIDAAMARWNLQPPPHLATTLMNIGDLNALITGAVGSGARPPMFGGQPAFFTNGGMCRMHRSGLGCATSSRRQVTLPTFARRSPRIP